LEPSERRGRSRVRRVGVWLDYRQRRLCHPCRRAIAERSQRDCNERRRPHKIAVGHSRRHQRTRD
jgi:hypothetical protein